MKKTSKFLLGLSLIFMVLSVCFAAENIYKNYRIINDFSQQEDAYPYADDIESGTPDLDEISKYVPDAEAAIKGPDFKKNIISPVTISYYKNINDDKPVYIIEKGETIQFDIENKVRSRITYCGIESLPTNKKGWRLSKPFKIDGKAANNKLLYVKLDDLTNVTYEWFDENPNALSYIGSVLPEGTQRNKRSVSRYILTYIDRCLYGERVFLSKDILNPIISVRVILCISESIISFVLFLLYRRERKYKAV